MANSIKHIIIDRCNYSAFSMIYQSPLKIRDCITRLGNKGIENLSQYLQSTSSLVKSCSQTQPSLASTPKRASLQDSGHSYTQFNLSELINHNLGQTVQASLKRQVAKLYTYGQELNHDSTHHSYTQLNLSALYENRKNSELILLENSKQTLSIQKAQEKSTFSDQQIKKIALICSMFDRGTKVILSLPVEDRYNIELMAAAAKIEPSCILYMPKSVLLSLFKKQPELLFFYLRMTTDWNYGFFKQLYQKCPQVFDYLPATLSSDQKKMLRSIVNTTQKAQEKSTFSDQQIKKIALICSMFDRGTKVILSLPVEDRYNIELMAAAAKIEPSCILYMPKSVLLSLFKKQPELLFFYLRMTTDWNYGFFKQLYQKCPQVFDYLPATLSSDQKKMLRSIVNTTSSKNEPSLRLTELLK